MISPNDLHPSLSVSPHLLDHLGRHRHRLRAVDLQGVAEDAPRARGRGHHTQLVLLGPATQHGHSRGVRAATVLGVEK